MNHRPIRTFFIATTMAATCALQGQQWTPPTPEELKMTAQPEVPGAPAVYLYREEITDDLNHYHSFSFRIKVLTERGKEYGTVELPYEAGGHAGIQVTQIAARTIHPDGTVIPFTGKPYDKLIEKSGDNKFMAKVFSLPDIEIGSILEYRYYIRYDDNAVIAPDWFIQSNLFTRKAHYQWKPTGRDVITNDERGTISNTVAWFPILPAGSEVKLTTLPAMGSSPPQNIMNLDIANVPPIPEEDYLPPLASLSYRVLFYYTPYRTQEQYWNDEGKHWSKGVDRFIAPGPAVRAAAQELAPAADPPMERVKKLYAAVMKLENTDFTRSRTSAEDRANGAKEIRNTDDILMRKRGSGDQLTELFVALARSAGFKAYLAGVCNRDRHFFLKGYLTFRQLDDYLAIVNVDGKEILLDPGQRSMPFQQIAWPHTFAEGMRQTDKGATFFNVPGQPYTSSKLQRIAVLRLDANGEANGSIRMIHTGVTALHLRQQALAGDRTSLDRELISSCERMLGKGMEVKVDSIDKLDDYEQPLTVIFSVKGAIASSAGHRLLLPADLFEAQSSPTFTNKERKLGVFFHYPHMVQDVIRVNFPAGMTVDSMPKTERTAFQKYALYDITSEKTATSYTVRRNLFLGEISFPVAEYPELRTFYNSFETQDREPVVLNLGENKQTVGMVGPTH